MAQETTTGPDAFDAVGTLEDTARPESRDRHLQLRVTESEKQEVRRKAQQAGLTMTDFVLSSIRTAEVVPSQELHARTVALNKIGANLNQIVRWANSYKASADALEVVEALVALEREARRVADDLRQQEAANADRP